LHRPRRVLGWPRRASEDQGHQEEVGVSESTKFDTIEDHLTAAGEKLKDLTEVHLPALARFVAELRKNPLVTAFRASIPGEIADDTMAVLNGLLPILGALGGKAIQPTVPPTPDSGSSSSETAQESPTSGGSDNG
jgi:hypothetical protein